MSKTERRRKGEGGEIVGCDAIQRRGLQGEKGGGGGDREGEMDDGGCPFEGKGGIGRRRGRG